jgi:hypothetical protein
MDERLSDTVTFGFDCARAAVAEPSSAAAASADTATGTDVKRLDIGFLPHGISSAASSRETTSAL